MALSKPKPKPKLPMAPEEMPPDFISLMETKQAMQPPEEEMLPEEMGPEGLPLEEAAPQSLSDVLVAALEKQAKIKQLLAAILEEL